MNREQLKAFAGAPMEQLFRKFRAGVIYFGVGGIMIYLANVAVEPSILQELVMLSGILLGAVGFMLAMIMQFRMIVSRIYHFFNKD